MNHANRCVEDTQKEKQNKTNKEINIFVFHPVHCTYMVADFIQVKQEHCLLTKLLNSIWREAFYYQRIMLCRSRLGLLWVFFPFFPPISAESQPVYPAPSV